MSDDNITPQELSEMKAMLDYDISLIETSPFGGTIDGRAISQILKTLNKQGKIIYGVTVSDARGDWDGELIRINKDYQGKMFPSIVELVHEGSHVLWRQRHPKKSDLAASIADNEADEDLARKNQLTMYVWLKAKKGCPVDAELEARLNK